MNCEMQRHFYMLGWQSSSTQSYRRITCTLRSRDICHDCASLGVCVYTYLNSNEKAKVYIRLVFSIIHAFLPLQSKLLSIQESQHGYNSCENFHMKCGSLLKPLPGQLHLPHAHARLLSSHFPPCLLKSGAEQMAVP